MAQAGVYNHYCEVQKITFAQADDGSGDRTETYVTLFPVWAKIEGQSVRDLIASRQDQSQVSHRITVRQSDVSTIEIGAGYRLLCEGRVYRIIGALPDNKTGRDEVTLACESGAFQWQDNQQ